MIILYKFYISVSILCLSSIFIDIPVTFNNNILTEACFELIYSIINFFSSLAF